MLMISGTALIGAAYLLIVFAYFTCRHRPTSFWASETAVLVVLAPGVMILLAAGCALLAKAWIDGELQHLDGMDGVIAATGVVLIVVFGYLSGLRLRGTRAPTA